MNPLKLETYSGVLDLPKMGRHEAKAYRSYKNQCSRCYNQSVAGYKTYGAMGISVEYGPRELIGWYLNNIYNFTGKNPEIGRKDHSKNYSLDNIEIVSKSENSKEMIKRTGNIPNKKRSKSVLAFSNYNGEMIAAFYSIGEAGRYLSIDPSNVSRSIKMSRPTKIGLLFKEGWSQWHSQ